VNFSVLNRNQVCRFLEFSINQDRAGRNYSENRFAQEEEGEVTISCLGIYVNDVYAMTAHDSCMCTRQLYGLFQEIYTNICLKYQE
jgi:hypothetical protein